MGIVFDKLHIPYNNQGLKIKNGRVRIIVGSNIIQIYYLDNSDTRGLLSFDIDFDILTNVKISLSDTFFEISGSINDSDVTSKLSKGEKIVNRKFFFDILRLHHYALKKNESMMNQDFHTITGIYLDATTKISEAISAARENKNFTLEPKPCILKSDNVYYDVSECSINILENIEDYCFKSYYNSVSVILGDSLGKSTIGAQVVVDNFKKKEWKISKRKLNLGTSLVICDIQDIVVYTKKFTEAGLNSVVIRNFKQFNSLTYLNFSKYDVVVLSSVFMSSFSKKNDVVKYDDRTVVVLDMLFDKNFINRSSVNLSIINFDILVIDIEDTSRLTTRLSKLSYTTCIKLCDSIDSIPNTYDTCLTLDYSKTSVSTVNANFSEEVLKLTKKENILMTESCKKIFKDLFLLSPKINALFFGVKIQVANSSREVSAILRDKGANYFDKQECPICFEKSEEKIVALCGHSFCPDCARNSFSKKPACPMCRTPVFGSNYIYLTEEKDSLEWTSSSLVKKIVEFCTVNRDTNCIIHTSSKLTSESVSQILDNNGIDSVISSITKGLQASMNYISKSKCSILITYFEEGKFKKFKIQPDIKSILLLPESESIESRKFITRLCRSGSRVTQLFT